MKAQREPAHAGMSFSERGHPTRRSTFADAEVSQPGGTYAPTRLANSERSTCSGKHSNSTTATGQGATPTDPRKGTGLPIAMALCCTYMSDDGMLQ
jgi:hypothetical protein